LKYSPDMNLGEVLGVAVNSKGRIAVLNHPGSSTSGPVYGNARRSYWSSILQVSSSARSGRVCTGLPTATACATTALTTCGSSIRGPMRRYGSTLPAM
jgi:hypothetical protein